MKARKRTEMGREIYQKKNETPKLEGFVFGFIAGFIFTVILMNCLR